MEAGKVKWFNNARGYGFIVRAGEAEDDVFVHYSVIESEGYRSLSPGQTVEFEITKGPKGLQATNVKAKMDRGAERVPVAKLLLKRA
jgi:CspA family cold shock protein